MDDFITWHQARVLRRTGKALSASTLRSTRTRLRSALRAAHTEELSVLAHKLTDSDSAELLFDTLAVTNQPGSLRLVYEACKSLHQYATAQGWVDEPLGIAAPAKGQQKAITVYSQEDVDTLVTTARGKSLRWFMFLATMAHTGRRVSEVLGIRWEWIQLDAPVPHIALPTTKNGNQAYVPLDAFLLEHVFTPENMAKLQAEPAGRFNRKPAEHPFPWTYNCAEKMMRLHCEKVGVVHRGFHCLRHTKATEMLSRGVPIHAVSKLLGHSSVKTTERIYDHTTALSFAGYLEAPAPPKLDHLCSDYIFGGKCVKCGAVRGRKSA